MLYDWTIVRIKGYQSALIWYQVLIFVINNRLWSLIVVSQWYWKQFHIILGMPEAGKYWGLSPLVILGKVSSIIPTNFDCKCSSSSILSSHDLTFRRRRLALPCSLPPLLHRKHGALWWIFLLSAAGHLVWSALNIPLYRDLISSFRIYVVVWGCQIMNELT